MALPRPDEILNQKRNNSGGLPSPDTVVPSLIKQREEREATKQRNQQLRQLVPEVSNPFVMTNNFNEMIKPQPQPSKKEQINSWVEERLAMDRKNTEKNPVMKSINNFLEPASKQVYNAIANIPGLASFQKGAGDTLGVQTFTAPEVGPAAVNIPARLTGNLVGGLTNPTNLSQGLLNAPIQAGKGVAQSLASKAPVLANKYAQKGIEGAVAGGIQGGVISGARGETDLDELALNIGLGAGLGAAGDIALTGVGSLIKYGGNKAKDVAEGIIGNQLKAANAIEQAAGNVSSKSMPAPETIIPPKVPEPSISPASSAMERGFNKTLRESEGVTPQVREGLANSPERTYNPITNEETLKRANDLIEKSGLDATEAQLMTKNRFNADDVAASMRMIQELQNTGQVERAVTIADKLAAQLTKAGQTVQAASIWNRLSPEGALLAAQRKVTRINENLLRGQEQVKISPEQARTITDTAGAIQASGVSQERAGTVMEIMERVRNGENILPDEKQTVLDFVSDAKRFLSPSKEKTVSPKTTRQPKEMQDVRVRDRVTSFLEEQEQAALDRIKSRRGRMNSTPFDEWADYAVVGATKLAKGAIKFADWSEQMVRDLGENVRPYLGEIFAKSQEMQSQTVKKINDQVISRAERVAEGYIKSNEAKLSSADVDFIRNMAQKVSALSDQEKRIASQDLQAVLQGFEKVGIGRKISSAQYISMLLNPLTQIRNIVGNELLYRLERIAKVISTPLDIATSKITGGPRTVTFKRGPSVWEDYFKPSKDYISSLGEGLKAGWKGVSPEGLTSKYDIQGQAFRSKYNPVTYLEKSLGASLQGFDYAAYTRATNQTMSEMAYLDALNKGIKGDEAIRNHMQTVMTNLDDATHNIAREYGKFVTLQNDSKLASALTGFRRGTNKLTTGSSDFGAGSIIIPFAKTPANLLLRGLDYSPAGILKAFKQTYDVLRNPNTDLTRADVMMSVSRSLIGTSLGAAAYWLADKGALFGQSNKDSEIRKLMQGTGIKDFQINGSAVMRMINAVFTGGDVDEAAKLKPGDTLWAYEWAQPTSMPIAIGSNIHQSIKQKQGALQTAGEAALSGASTLLDSSVLSGIKEAFQIPQGEDNAFKAVLNNLIKQVPSQFVPSLMRQFNTLFDDTLKETYAMPGDTLGKITNSAKSSIPYLSQQMPQRVSTLGEPQTRLNTFLDVFVSPSARSIYKPTPEAQLVIDLLNETGDSRVVPRAVQKYVSGKDIVTGEQKRIDLTPEQFVELQTIVGQETANRLKKINPNLSTEMKVKKVIEALDQAGKIGRNKIKKDVGLRKTK